MIELQYVPKSSTVQNNIRWLRGGIPVCSVIATWTKFISFVKVQHAKLSPDQHPLFKGWQVSAKIVSPESTTKW